MNAVEVVIVDVGDESRDSVVLGRENAGKG